MYYKFYILLLIVIASIGCRNSMQNFLTLGWPRQGPLVIGLMYQLRSWVLKGMQHLNMLPQVLDLVKSYIKACCFLKPACKFLVILVCCQRYLLLKKKSYHKSEKVFALHCSLRLKASRSLMRKLMWPNLKIDVFLSVTILILFLSSPFLTPWISIFLIY